MWLPDLVDHRKEQSLPVGVTVALRFLRREKMHKRRRHRNLAEDLGLTPNMRHSRLEGVDTIWLPRLAAPYPPPSRDIYETETIAKIWKTHRAKTPHPDPRSGLHGWPQLEKLDSSKLAYTVAGNESTIIRDKDSDKIVAMVLRHFAGNEEVLEWVNGIVDENVGLRRGIRVCGSAVSIT